MLLVDRQDISVFDLVRAFWKFLKKSLENKKMEMENIESKWKNSIEKCQWKM